MSLTTKAFHLNTKLEIEGSFDLDSSAAVKTIALLDGTTKTVRGEGMSVAKASTGTYTVTVKLASGLDGQPVFQPVEAPLYSNASLFGASLATALQARVSAIAADTNGNLAITVVTMDAAGAATDTTGAVTVTFKANIETTRMGGVF